MTTTLRDRIAAELMRVAPYLGRGDAHDSADAILALFRDEAPPSDEWLREVEESARGYTASNRALYDLGHARGYAKGAAERAELQRRLGEALEKAADLESRLDIADADLEQYR